MFNLYQSSDENKPILSGHYRAFMKAEWWGSARESTLNRRQTRVGGSLQVRSLQLLVLGESRENVPVPGGGRCLTGFFLLLGRWIVMWLYRSTWPLFFCDTVTIFIWQCWCWWAEGNLCTPPKLNRVGNGLAAKIVLGAAWDIIILSYRRHLVLLGKNSDLLPKFMCNIWSGWCSNEVCGKSILLRLLGRIIVNQKRKLTVIISRV